MPFSTKKKKDGKKVANTSTESWVEVQKATFTNWINDKLRHTDHLVEDISKDLEDGLILICLLEKLSRKTITAKYHPKPTRAVHRNQNLSVVFSFMTDVEQLPLVNISPTHIIKHSITEILSLVWLLISRYAITEASVGTKTLLLKWISVALPDREITDFTTCWRDGINLLALVNFCRPGIVPDLACADHTKALENTQQAMNLAEEKLNIPQILSPKDMIAEKPDEHSIMTYLSFFSGPKSPGQKAIFLWIKQKLPDSVVVTNFTTDWTNGIALGSLVNAMTSDKFQEYEQFQHTKIESGVENCKQSLEAAKNLLGINATLTAEEFSNPDLNSLQRTAYLLQLYYATLKAGVVDVHFPEEYGPGQFMWVDISYPEGSLSAIKSYAKGDHVGVLETDIEALDNHKYRISFEAEQGDRYTLAVTVGGIRINGSPFVVDLTPPDPQAVEKINSILPKKVGIPAIFTFDTSRAGQGHLSGEVKGTASGPVPLYIDSTSPTNYQVSFIPMLGDVYNLTIRFADREINNSPFSIPLETLVHPENVFLGKPSVNEPGVPVTTPFDVKTAGEAELVVKCIGDKAGEIETSILSVDDNTVISFTPPIQDLYYLSVFFDNTEVKDSPLKINLYPELPDSKKVRLTDPPSGAVSSGAMIKIGFDTSEAGIGEITASCVGKTLGAVPVKVESNLKHKYEISFSPPDEDIFNIHVLWSEKHVPGSPFKLNLISKDHPDPTKCKILNLPNKTDVLLVVEEINFQVNTANAGKGTLVVTVDTDEVSNEESGSNSAVNNKESIDGNKSKQGEQEAKVTDVVPQETSGVIPETSSDVTPRETVDINPEASKDMVPEKDTNEEKKGENLPPEPPTLDEQEPKVTDVVAEATSDVAPGTTDAIEPEATSDEVPKKTTEPFTINVLKNSDNPALYDICFVPNRKGRYTLNVMWANKHVSNSPVTMDIISPQIAYVGTPAVINLKTIFRRKHLKAYAVCRSGGAHLKVKMDKIASGDYKLIFKPTQPGVYLMHVSTKDKPIENSPFVIRYIDSSNPAAIRVSGLKSELIAGEPIEFTIDAKDAGFGDITVAPLGSIYTQDSTLTAKDADVRSIYLHDNRDGTYSAVFTPGSAGETGLDIRFGGATVPGSPFQLSVLTRENEEAVPEKKKKDKKEKKSKSKSASTISGLNLGEVRFLVGEVHKFKIHCDDLGEGELTITTKPHAAADVDINQITSDDSYWVEILPKKPGKNEILVKFDGKHILGSPFHVTFLSRGEASKCILIDTPKECQKEMDDQVSFCISTKGAGKGKITATIKSVSSKTDIPCRVERSSKHHYHVVFSPTEGLNYLMSVRYDEIHIQGSPYKIALGDASLCRTEGEGLEQAWSGRWNKFQLDVEDAGPGDLKVIIEGEDPAETAGTIEQIISSVDENHYEVAYQPDFPGKYWITVKWGKLDIPGSPFDITCRKPLEPTHFTVDSVHLVHLGKPAHLAVTCSALIEESDKMSVSVHSVQEEKLQGEVERDSSGHGQGYMCTICPPELGKYFVYVLWDGKHVVGSPFEIVNVPTPTPNDLVIQAVEIGEGLIAIKVTGPTYAFRYGNLVGAVRQYIEVEGAEEIPITISDINDEECNVQFKPTHGGEYMLGIQYDDRHVPGSPFKLLSTDAAQCYAKGKGIVQAQTNEWNTFTVFTENGGPGDLRVEVEGEIEGEGDILLNALVTAASDIKYDVSYSPTIAGKYTISVFWDIQHIPGSPFNVVCCDPSRYTILKRPTEGILGKPIKIGIKEKAASPEFENLQVYASSKDHSKHPGEITKGIDGGYICSVLPPNLGKYMIHIQCNGFEIDQSLFKVKNFPPPVPEKVKAEGPGLENGAIGVKGNFSINIAEAGHGYLSFKVQGPKDGFKINLHHGSEDNNKIVAEYNPTHHGSYIISILWSGIHIPNSPFNVSVANTPPLSLSQVQESEVEAE